jgi:hypothetical protein
LISFRFPSFLKGSTPLFQVLTRAALARFHWPDTDRG